MNGRRKAKTLLKSKAYNILKKLYSFIPDDIRGRLDSYRLERRVRSVVNKLKHKSHSQAPTNSPELGLNVFGFLSAGLGLGEAARSTIRAANAVGLPIYTHEIPLKTHAVDPSVSFGTATRTSNFDINLFHFNPDRLEGLVLPEIKSAYLSSRYNIAFWFWETTELPDYWVTVSELFDEIWVGSSFCESVVKAKVCKPITRIPLNVAATEPDPSHGRRELGLPEQGFLFLTMMDFFSRPERKNPFGAIAAFEKAFGSGSTDAYLIVKVTNPGISREFKRLKEYSRHNRRIIIFDRFLARSELYSLISNIDCLVSLHRAEGFGLPIAEAMSFGKPVIATGWSANMDFMTGENSFPVSYDMTKLALNAPPYPRGTVWADPDIDDAADIMKKLVGNPALCREVGDKARADINSKFSAAVTGEKIVERLKQIQGRF